MIPPYQSGFAMNVQNATVSVERKIIRNLVKQALDKGYTVSVYDGEDWCLKLSNSVTLIMSSIQSTDSDKLVFRNANKVKIGAVLLVYGNGDDVISDYSDNEAMRALIGD